MYQQRAVRERPAKGLAAQALWTPASLSPDLTAEEVEDMPGLEPEQGDRYVVVDDLMDGTVTLAVCPWPSLNSLGDLVFEPSEELIAPEDLTHQAVSASREASGQMAADRPLRIGDAFLIRNLLVPEEAEPEGGSDQDDLDVEAMEKLKATRRAAWADVLPAWTIWDVTADARDAAKIALYSAVAPPLSTSEADQFSGDDDEPPPSALAAGPQQQPMV